ncbi:unnamed protein product, partial [Ectocarpus sp. 6 AP-2014]
LAPSIPKPNPTAAEEAATTPTEHDPHANQSTHVAPQTTNDTKKTPLSATNQTRKKTKRFCPEYRTRGARCYSLKGRAARILIPYSIPKGANPPTRHSLLHGLPVPKYLAVDTTT